MKKVPPHQPIFRTLADFRTSRANSHVTRHKLFRCLHAPLKRSVQRTTPKPLARCASHRFSTRLPSLSAVSARSCASARCAEPKQSLEALKNPAKITIFDADAAALLLVADNHALQPGGRFHGFNLYDAEQAMSLAKKLERSDELTVAERIAVVRYAERYVEQAARTAFAQEKMHELFDGTWGVLCPNLGPLPENFSACLFAGERWDQEDEEAEEGEEEEEDGGDEEEEEEGGEKEEGGGDEAADKVTAGESGAPAPGRATASSRVSALVAKVQAAEAVAEAARDAAQAAQAKLGKLRRALPAARVARAAERAAEKAAAAAEEEGEEEEAVDDDEEAEAEAETEAEAEEEEEEVEVVAKAAKRRRAAPRAADAEEARAKKPRARATPPRRAEARRAAPKRSARAAAAATSAGDDEDDDEEECDDPSWKADGSDTADGGAGDEGVPTPSRTRRAGAAAGARGAVARRRGGG